MKEVLNKAGRSIIKVYAVNPGEIRIYFDDRVYKNVSRSETTDICNSMIFGGFITHFDAEFLDDGELILYYNPLYQAVDIIESRMDSLIEYIEHSSED